MKTFFTIILLSILPTASLVAYNEIRSAYNVAEIERVHNLPVNISIPSNEIEVEFVPSATVQTIDSEIEIDFIADAE